jgi:hypothetical protein
MTASFSRRGPAPAADGDAAQTGPWGFVREHRAGLGAAAVAAAALVAGYAAWSRLAGQVRAQPDRVLFPEGVEVVGVAPWVKCDLRGEALRNASLDGGLPLDDPELPRRLARGFDMHPWVRQVIAVDVRHPAAARVEVACREPVAMVTVTGGLLAVDGEGVVLPSADFTPESAAAYPRITGIASSPQAPEGFPWGDPLVEEGAALAAAIGPEWVALGLEECRPVGGRAARGWELVGPGDRTIRFGSVPGREQAGEPAAAVKIARLRSLAAAAESPDTIDLTGAEPAEERQAEPPRSIPAP